MHMPTLCPIAIVSGCESCPVFKVCPAKSILGDQKPKADEKSDKKSEESSED